MLRTCSACFAAHAGSLLVSTSHSAVKHAVPGSAFRMPASRALSSDRSNDDRGDAAGAIDGPLHGHVLGYAPTAPLSSWSGMHATTILAVRKGGRVVRVCGARAVASFHSLCRPR